MKQKGKRTSFPVSALIVLLVILLCVATGGYLLASTTEWGSAAWNRITGRDSHDNGNGVPENGNDPDDPLPPDNGGEPPDNGSDDPQPPDNGQNGDPEPADPEYPVIKTGQVLIIPGTGAPAGGPAKTITSGTVNLNRKAIALTFDSGWLYDQTIPLLNMLDQHDVKATFFPRALWVQDHPELAREIVRRGHTMGNHSLTHPDMREMTVEQIRHEMRESTRIIQEVTGVRPYLFRPPYGAYNQMVLDVLGQEGYPYSIMWTVDTHDWAETMGGQTVTVDYIVNRVLNNASPDGIVLMHIAYAKTVNALPQMIAGLRQEGYTFATIDQMVPRPDRQDTTYTVKAGDTLWSIAQKYNTTVEKIIQANNL